jgi:hypothetical protein
VKPICHLGVCQSVTRELRICALFTHSPSAALSGGPICIPQKLPGLFLPAL